MTFLNPLFLFSLLAVAVPLIVHIFSRRRVREVKFSSLLFLESSQRRSMRSVKLRRMLLLILRMAAVACIALAFSRPVIKGKSASLFPGRIPVASCILVDRSYSMGVETDRGTLFDRAALKAQEIAKSVGDEDLLIIAAVDESARKIYEGEGRDESLVLEALDEIGPSWKTTDLKSGVSAARKMLAETGLQARELYVISDFQKSSLKRKGVDERAGGKSITDVEEEKTRDFIIPLRDAPGVNVAVEDVICPSVSVHAGEAVDLEIILRNTSTARDAVVQMSVFLEGVRIINREIKLAPGERRKEEAAFTVDTRGWIRGEVRLSRDKLPHDDRKYFVLNSAEKIKVLLAGKEENFYIRQAVSPEGSMGGMLLYGKDTATITSEAVDKADVIVIGSGGELWEEDVEIIEKFIEKGGGVIVFVQQEDEEFIRRISGFTPEVRLRNKGLRRVSLKIPEKRTSLLSSFSKEELRGLSRLRFVSDIMVEGIPENHTLMSFKDESPFIWKEKAGKGTLIFVVFKPGIEGGELVVSPYFLPIVQRMITDAAGRAESECDIRVGGSAEWRAHDPDSLNCRFSGISGVGGSVELDEGEITGFTRKPGGLLIDPVNRPGFISINSKEGIVGRIAVNTEAKGESDLIYAGGSEAADSLGIEDAAVIGAEESMKRKIRRAREGREIAAVFLISAIVLLIVEILIAQGARKKNREEYVG
ncbi:MAG: BatA and WFA domain-containing protein [Candidatus Krumholzibacteriota bacterium]|nr:BatA and WFA domain-containing protein [Candidatus Krumholzibacteriota bacterium]